MSKKSRNKKLDEALDELIVESGDRRSILSEGGLLKQLTKRLVERVLESEMDDHLGYAKYNHSNVDNARNGHNRPKWSERVISAMSATKPLLQKGLNKMLK